METTENGAPEKDMTAARIVELHLESRGGEGKLRALEGYRLKGRVREGIREYAISYCFQAPNKYRKEIFREDLGWQYLTVFASDGDHVWQQELKPERKPAWIIEEEAQDDAMPENFLMDQLIDWEQKGHALSYAGKAVIGGSPTYIVKATLKDGLTVFYYFDQKHFLLRNMGRQVEVAERLVDVDHLSLQWRVVDGVRFETAYEIRNRGELLRRIEYDTIEVNPAMDEALIEVPPYRELWLRQTGQGSSRLERMPSPEEETSP